MNCDPLARWYRWLEYAGFGRALERRRLEYLPRLAQARRILMLGEGDGRFLAALLRINPAAEVDYVDGSRKMLSLARQSAAATRGQGEHVGFHCGDALAWLESRPPGRYDVVCTHFFLDCFEQDPLKALTREIARHATGSASWIISEFRYPDAGFASLWGRAFIALLYGFFRLSTGLRVRSLPEHGPAIEAVGFRLAQRVVAGGGILESERWERG